MGEEHTTVLPLTLRMQVILFILWTYLFWSQFSYFLQGYFYHSLNYPLPRILCQHSPSSNLEMKTNKNGDSRLPSSLPPLLVLPDLPLGSLGTARPQSEGDFIEEKKQTSELGELTWGYTPRSQGNFLGPKLYLQKKLKLFPTRNSTAQREDEEFPLNGTSCPCSLHIEDGGRTWPLTWLYAVLGDWVKGANV